jgi:hypothetical protein
MAGKGKRGSTLRMPTRPTDTQNVKNMFQLIAKEDVFNITNNKSKGKVWNTKLVTS